ncbi:MAG: hypothetical protein ACHRHE_09470 [Tepidisphaerales bacterium]
MKTRLKRRPFDSLTGAEKEAVYNECEHIGPEDGLPLTRDDIRKHRQSGLRPGRPRVGLGAARINISIERGLLRKADAFARRHKLSRAAVVARSLDALLASAA